MGVDSYGGLGPGPGSHGGLWDPHTQSLIGDLQGGRGTAGAEVTLGRTVETMSMATVCDRKTSEKILETDPGPTAVYPARDDKPVPWRRKGLAPQAGRGGAQEAW